MTAKGARDALLRRFAFLDQRIVKCERPDVLDRDQAERSAVRMGADWMDVRVYPEEGDKLVVRPRYGGIETILVADGEQVAHIMIRQEGSKLLITTDGDVTLHADEPAAPVR